MLRRWVDERYVECACFGRVMRCALSEGWSSGDGFDRVGFHALPVMVTLSSHTHSHTRKRARAHTHANTHTHTHEHTRYAEHAQADSPGAKCRRKQGARWRVEGGWCRVEGAECRVQSAGCRVEGGGWMVYQGVCASCCCPEQGRSSKSEAPESLGSRVQGLVCGV